jgi:hypothetical protein
VAGVEETKQHWLNIVLNKTRQSASLTALVFILRFATLVRTSRRLLWAAPGCAHPAWVERLLERVQPEKSRI